MHGSSCEPRNGGWGGGFPAQAAQPLTAQGMELPVLFPGLPSGFP